MQQIIFVTGNEMKVRHANEALVGTDFELVAQKLDIIENQERKIQKMLL